ncbi:MAG: hypothetical protein WBC44_15415 [Planctomycetaceae bacterium]
MFLKSLRIAIAATAVAPVWETISLGSDAVPAAAAGIAGAETPPRLIVLKNGTVVEGRIRIAQGGYEVDGAAGRVFLADSFIWYTAENRQDAYKTLRERIPYATADSHVRIAQWCVENNLPSTAKEELRLALRLEPDHADARSMLRLLTAGPNDAEATSNRHRLDDEDNPTLGGLPHETARAFVSRVQPILVNRCGNAACHGAASNSPFTLQNARNGNPAFRAHTHENLDAALEQVTPEAPLSSPLITQAQQIGHGGSRKPLFVGRAGKAQLQAVAAWVDEVSRTMKPVQKEAGPEEPNRLALTSATAEMPEATSTAEPSTVTTAADPFPVADVKSQDADPTAVLLESVIQNGRPDAFDPAAFNRQFAPRPDSSPLSSSDGPMR